MKKNSEQNNVISFPASNTYELIQKTLIHAHPIKRGFPSNVTPYVTIRRKGGYMDDLYKVCGVIDLIPDEISWENQRLTVPEIDRLSEYYVNRKNSFGFRTKDTLYRFYFLESYYKIEPAFQMYPNLQSYRYYSLRDFISYNSKNETLINLNTKELSETEKELIIKSRIGQGSYREKLVSKYSGRCAICAMKRTDLLIASHIKEWKNSNANERLDVNNGLLLCTLHDSLFDKHLITFDKYGKIIISESLDENDRALLNINSNMKIDMNDRMKEFMKFPIGQYVYAKNNQEIYINQYLASETTIKQMSGDIYIKQKTDYPRSGVCYIEITSDSQQKQMINLRVPGWCIKYSLWINGEKINNVYEEKGYIKLYEHWGEKTEIKLEFDMPVEMIKSHPYVKENAGKVAVMKGPVVYCAEEVDNKDNFDTIKLGDSMQIEIIRDYLEKNIDAIKIDQDGSKEIFVPYFYWDNREKGKMAVWFPNK